MESTKNLQIRENEYNNMCKGMIIDIKKRFRSKINKLKKEDNEGS